MKRQIWWGFAILFILAAALTGYFFSVNKKTNTVSINGNSVAVSIADTKDERVKGLSGMKKLTPGNGMLFVFDSSDLHGIWMKDMNFPIDIVWLNSEKEVVFIKSAATPDSYPEVFRPTIAAKYVLELPKGSLTQYGIVVGQAVDF